MFALKVKKLLGFVIMLAAVPAAIVLAPLIGVWTIALVLGSGAVGGWLTLDPASGRIDDVKRTPIDADDEISMFHDPKSSWVPGNFYNVLDVRHDRD